MTEETADIQRLDYGEPPPGYQVGQGSEAQWYWVRGPVDGEGHRGDIALGEDAALTAAWTHVKVHHDPPGVYRCGPLALYITFGPGLPQLLSRTEAWAWYDRRLALAAKLDVALIVDEEPFKGRIIRTVVPAGEARHFDGEQRPYAAWPRILTWSDEQVAEVERWLADSNAETPEVLRG